MLLRRLLHASAIVLLLAAPATAELRPVGPDAPDAAELLERTLAVYAGADTYADEGEAVMTLASPGSEPAEMATSFGTAFRRGGLLYFSASMATSIGGRDLDVPRPEQRLWSDATGTVFIGIAGDKPRSADSLAEGLGQAAGGAVLPAMLVTAWLGVGDDDRFNAFTKLGEAELLGVEAVDGVECWVVEAQSPTGAMKMHLDRDTGLLRRLRIAAPVMMETTLRPTLEAPAGGWDLPPKPDAAALAAAAADAMPPLPDLPPSLADAPAPRRCWPPPSTPTAARPPSPTPARTVRRSPAGARTRSTSPRRSPSTSPSSGANASTTPSGRRAGRAA